MQHEAELYNIYINCAPAQAACPVLCLFSILNVYTLGLLLADSETLAKELEQTAPRSLGL